MREIYTQCKNFKEKTGKVFPYLKLDSMMFDQKSLKIVLRNKELIYEGMGVTDSEQGSVEL